MAITSCLTNTFKEELLGGYHSFNASGDTPAGSAFKIALYSSGSANLGTTTTQWVVASTPSADPTNTYEVTTTGSGYTSGGKALTNTGVAKSTVTSYTDFSDVSWTSASFTANGAMIYNTTTDGGSSTTDAICVIAFGGDKTVSSGTFTVQFPAAGATTAILRLA